MMHVAIRWIFNTMNFHITAKIKTFYSFLAVVINTTSSLEYRFLIPILRRCANNAIILFLECTKPHVKQERGSKRCSVIQQSSWSDQTGKPIRKIIQVYLIIVFTTCIPFQLNCYTAFINRSRIELEELKDQSIRVDYAVEAEESSQSCGNCQGT